MQGSYIIATQLLARTALKMLKAMPVTSWLYLLSGLFVKPS